MNEQCDVLQQVGWIFRYDGADGVERRGFEWFTPGGVQSESWRDVRAVYMGSPAVPPEKPPSESET